jgi:hypothetical protein
MKRQLFKWGSGSSAVAIYLKQHWYKTETGQTRRSISYWNTKLGEREWLIN